MPRKPNDIETVPIKISTTPPIEAYLKKLVATGLYGKNPAEAAERLVSKSIEGLLKDGSLIRARDRRPPPLRGRGSAVTK